MEGVTTGTTNTETTMKKTETIKQMAAISRRDRMFVVARVDGFGRARCLPLRYQVAEIVLRDHPEAANMTMAQAKAAGFVR